MPETQTTDKPLYEIDTDADVERAMREVLAPRRPPMNLPPVEAAWKAIHASATRKPVPIIFDTDIGTDVDDAIALTFALLRRELDVRAIITSRGEVRQRTAIVSRLLKVMGKMDIPFAPGSPLMFNGQTMRDKPVNQFPFGGDEPDRPRPACENGMDLLRQTVEADPGNVWLVVVGPMTNAALLIRDHPTAAAKLKGIVCMGGEPTRAVGETNFKNDPEAAELVCRTGLLKFVGTYDVTIRMLMPHADVQRLAQARTPHARAVVELIRLWRTHYNHKPGPVVFDLCPLVWLFAPEMFTTQEMGLKVELAPAERRAVTSASPDAPPCAVSTDVNAVAVHRLLMDTLVR